MTNQFFPKVRLPLIPIRLVGPIWLVGIWLVAGLAFAGIGLTASLVAAETTAESEATTDGAVIDGAVIDGRLLFELDVMPVLSVAGCNAGACHGKQGGQNGFQLSLLGFDADFDYTAIVHEAHGRRLAPAAPKRSLLLRKVSAQVPHGGGLRLAPDSPLYEVLQRWIVQGMPRSTDSDPVLEHITLSPEQRTLEPESKLSLVATAHYSDGSTRDVTHLTTYQSSEPAIVAVDDDGTLRAGSLAGETSIMARYVTEIATWNTGIPVAGEIDPADYEQLPRWNFIDGLVWDKLHEMKTTPSGLCSDSKFLRRAHLDIIGRLPTSEEAKAFLADSGVDKRPRLIDQLLQRPEYADFWASKWADLLRPNPYRVGIKATLSLDAWLRDVFRQNLPYDKMTRQLVAAQGSTWRNGAATFFRDRRQPDEIITAVSQLFLGVRLGCAKCHHHPFEVWGQDDFYQMAAFFARVGRKGGGLSPPISGAEEIVFVSNSGNVKHPLTGKNMTPRALSGAAPDIGPDDDPRDLLVDWMISEKSGFFAKTGANRIWADLMGRGVVEPVDDLRVTNPPSNGPLLEALAAEFRRVEFDQKELIRTITGSYVYQLDSLPNERNMADTRNYSRHYRQQLRAEVLLDAVCDVTGIAEEFIGRKAVAVPLGSRAVEAWTVRTQSWFLDVFGRPDPNQDPPCERIGDSTVVQALHLMNAPKIHQKVVHKEGRAAQLATSDLNSSQIVTNLYLTTYARYPSEEELATVVPLFGDSADERRAATEDLMWALVNTPEFMLSD
jgi:hypothetical protein